MKTTFLGKKIINQNQNNTNNKNEKLILTYSSKMWILENKTKSNKIHNKVYKKNIGPINDKIDEGQLRCLGCQKTSLLNKCTKSKIQARKK